MRSSQQAGLHGPRSARPTSKHGVMPHATHHLKHGPPVWSMDEDKYYVVQQLDDTEHPMGILESSGIDTLDQAYEALTKCKAAARAPKPKVTLLRLDDMSLHVWTEPGCPGSPWCILQAPPGRVKHHIVPSTHSLPNTAAMPTMQAAMHTLGVPLDAHTRAAPHPPGSATHAADQWVAGNSAHPAGLGNGGLPARAAASTAASLLSIIQQHHSPIKQHAARQDLLMGGIRAGGIPHTLLPPPMVTVTRQDTCGSITGGFDAKLEQEPSTHDPKVASRGRAALVNKAVNKSELDALQGMLQLAQSSPSPTPSPTVAGQRVYGDGVMQQPHKRPRVAQ